MMDLEDELEHLIRGIPAAEHGPPQPPFGWIGPRETARREKEIEKFKEDLFKGLPPRVELTARPGGCQEASSMSHSFYIPCNAPASRMVAFLDQNGKVQEGPYRMCEPCAWHNTSNRGASYVCEEAGQHLTK